MSLYLVTGGAGFIGSNLVSKLLSLGHQVRVLDNYYGGRFEKRVFPSVEYIEGDIMSLSDLRIACNGVSGIFHMAAIPRMPYSVSNPLETHAINVTGTLNVLFVAKELGVKRVVFSASSAAYGNQDVASFSESLPSIPMSPYGLHKLIGEEYCTLFSKLYGLSTVSLRYFNVYGPLMDPEGDYALVIGKFLKQKKAGLPMTICGDGEYFRDYVHVSDVATANILAMESDRVGKGEVINVGTGKANSVNELVEVIGGDSVSIAERPGDPRRTEADISKARELLGFDPKVSLASGIEGVREEFGF
jgi:UDP-glucose 4-epimerase